MKIDKNYDIIAFYPKIHNPIRYTHDRYPFSFNYIIQCYYRLKERKNHETLDFETNKKAHIVLFKFLKLYRNQPLRVSDNFIKNYPLSITDESEQIKLSEELRKSFNKFMSKIKQGSESKTYFLNIIKVFEDTEEEIQQFLDVIETEYPKDKFKSTVKDLEEEIEKCKIKIYLNKYNSI
jgi:hypothetical protein